MGERRYAVAYLYGYGKYHYYSGGYSSPYYDFTREASIYFNDLGANIMIEPPFRKIQITENSSGYASHKVNVPLYLVEENGIWREYFTGTVIQFYDFSSTGNKDGVIRKMVFGNSHGGTLDYIEPKNFANQISHYTKEQIKDMAGQFLRLCEDAIVWSKNYDRASEIHRQAELEKAQANRLASETLERGIGQYSTVSSTRSADSQKKSGGGFFRVLIILLVLLFIWWIFR